MRAGIIGKEATNKLKISYDEALKREAEQVELEALRAEKAKRDAEEAVPVKPAEEEAGEAAE